ncbi:hypothetical protein, partial [Extensimonas sp. H3M7-6]|uniref:hypothetical protein n=1 Tax=Extensimonas soli TaxID=3031322 RepID=UPI0023DA793D
SHYLFVADLVWFHHVALLALLAYPLLGHISLNRTRPAMGRRIRQKLVTLRRILAFDAQSPTGC